MLSLRCSITQKSFPATREFLTPHPILLPRQTLLVKVGYVFFADFLHMCMQVYMQCSFCGLFKKNQQDDALHVFFVVCFHLYLSIPISLCMLSCSSHVGLFSPVDCSPPGENTGVGQSHFIYTHTHTHSFFCCCFCFTINHRHFQAYTKVENMRRIPTYLPQFQC